MIVSREIICVGEVMYLSGYDNCPTTNSYEFTTDKRKALRLADPDLTERLQVKIRAIYPGKRVYREIVNERIS